MEQQHGRHAHTDIHLSAVRSHLRVLHDLHQQQKIQTENHYYYCKSVFFGEGREDEIGMSHRQKTQLRLRPMCDSASPHPAVPYRDLGLNHLVAASARVLGWVYER